MSNHLSNEIETTARLLIEKYESHTLTRIQTAEAIGVSISTLDSRIASGRDIPRYRRLGDSPKSRIQFPAIEVAKYLCDLKVVD